MNDAMIKAEDDEHENLIFCPGCGKIAQDKKPGERCTRQDRVCYGVLVLKKVYKKQGIRA